MESMENGKKIALGVTAALIVAVGVRVGLIYKANHEEGPPPKPQYTIPKLSEDDAVFLRKQRPDSLKDERELIGKTVWISAGGQMDFYPYSAHHVDYSKRAGTLLGAEPLLIKDVFEQTAPKSGRAVARIPAGQRHVLLAFTMPKSASPAALYATPVGYYADGNYTFFTDEIFFYDDPHILYKHWSPEMWAHVEKHEAVVGMSETQAMMALGQVMTPSSDSFGNRTVTYNNNEHPMKVVFENNKAISVTPAS
jgi:hypothetical protein